MQSYDDDMLDEDRDTSTQLKIAVERDPLGVAVKLEGELDIATAPDVDRLLDQLVQENHRRLLIDLVGVEFIDSTGLASILRARKSADANGHRLTVRRGSSQVQRLFELTGIVDQFSFED